MTDRSHIYAKLEAKQTITTTLNRIREHSPCEDGWRKLLAGLGKTTADDEPLPYAKIVEINGIIDALWACCVEPNYEKEWRLFAVWCVRQVQYLMKDKYSLNALDVAERYAHGDATKEELDASWDAYWDASWDAATEASRASDSVAYWDASSAASAAAFAASRAARAASAAAFDAARSAQTKRFLEIVGGDMTSKKRTDAIRNSGPRIKAFIIENITYDEAEGALYMRYAGRVRLPIEPGDDSGKRPRVRIMGQPVLAAHVAFIARTKQWPEWPIRHLNGDEADIRWDNMIMVRETTNAEDDEFHLFMAGNDRFLADLRKHHPNGPPSYAIKAGKPIIFYSYRSPAGLGGSPAGLCADTI